MTRPGELADPRAGRHDQVARAQVAGSGVHSIAVRRALESTDTRVVAQLDATFFETPDKSADRFGGADGAGGPVVENDRVLLESELRVQAAGLGGVDLSNGKIRGVPRNLGNGRSVVRDGPVRSSEKAHGSKVDEGAADFILKKTPLLERAEHALHLEDGWICAAGNADKSVGAGPLGGGSGEALEHGDMGVRTPPSQTVSDRQTVDACPDHDNVVDYRVPRNASTSLRRRPASIASPPARLRM